MQPKTSFLKNDFNNKNRATNSAICTIQIVYKNYTNESNKNQNQIIAKKSSVGC
jgi:hypothetical protein